MTASQRPAPDASQHTNPMLALGVHVVIATFVLLCSLSRAEAAGPPHQPALWSTLTSDQVFQLALEARTERDYPAMLTLLRQAGNDGHLQAQETLSSVLLSGANLYGNAIAANPCEAEQWAQRAALQGSAVARHLKTVMNGMRDLSQGREACAAQPATGGAQRLYG